MRHFLLTRFNVKKSVRSKSAGVNWTRHRMELFEELCFPSVRSQSNQNFDWLILIDAQTSDWVISRLERMQQQRHFVLVPVDPNRFQTSANVLQDILAKSAEPLLTSRLDNDDIIAPAFIENVRNNLDMENNQWINLESGVKLGPKGLYPIVRQSNAFISLYECRPPFLSALGISHTCASHYAPIKNISTSAAWIQVIHGSNIMNHFSSRVPCQPVTDVPKLLPEFGEDLQRRIMNWVSAQASTKVTSVVRRRVRE